MQLTSLAALLMAAFLIGAPMLSMAAARWAGHAPATGQRTARSRRQVWAVLLQAPPPRAVTGGDYGWDYIDP